MTSAITTALTQANTIGIVTGPSVSREVWATLNKLSGKYPKGWLVPERSPIKDSLMVDRELPSVNDVVRDCDVLVAFPVLECPQRLHELPPSLIPASGPWEAMANAIRLDIPTLAWSNADLHEPPQWLVPLAGGWWYGRKGTLF